MLTLSEIQDCGAGQISSVELYEVRSIVHITHEFSVLTRQGRDDAKAKRDVVSFAGGHGGDLIMRGRGAACTEGLGHSPTSAPNPLAKASWYCLASRRG